MKCMALDSSVTETTYIFEKNHNLLKYGVTTNGGIGDNGENLTITVVSLNRSSLTIRLMKSIENHIPNYKGEFIIIDNGSDERELNNLKNELEKITYKNRIVELKKNYGPSGGRNRAMKYVTTDWVLCLDNDVYFIENPLSEIQKTISQLGCHFFNLPLLDDSGSRIFAFGGHLYLCRENSKIVVSGGSAYRQLKYDRYLSKAPFLSTFLYAGACVVNKTTFLSVGGYDEEMFAFEDIDFSIRLFQLGIKVGNCGKAVLVHDHKKTLHDLDKKYERIRFSEQINKKSAVHFEKKHGISVWHNNVDIWLENRRKDLEIYVKNNDKIIDVSIIIFCKNEVNNLKATIDSIITSQSSLKFEIIILDDGLVEKSTEFLSLGKQIYEDVVLIKTKGLSCAEARNVGTKASKGKYLFFCDADIEVQERWLDNLVNTLENHNAHIVVPCICDVFNESSAAYGVTWNDKLQFTWLRNKPNNVTEIPMASGAILCITKEIFKKINGFDTFFNGYDIENQELCLKAWLYGYKIVINPEIKIKYLFRKISSYKSNEDDIIYNTLCMAYSHFKIERVYKTINMLKISKSFTHAADRIKSNMEEILKQRNKYLNECVYDDYYFFEKFNIPF